MHDVTVNDPKVTRAVLIQEPHQRTGLWPGHYIERYSDGIFMITRAVRPGDAGWDDLNRLLPARALRLVE